MVASVAASLVCLFVNYFHQLFMPVAGMCVCVYSKPVWSLGVLNFSVCHVIYISVKKYLVHPYYKIQNIFNIELQLKNY